MAKFNRRSAVVGGLVASVLSVLSPRTRPTEAVPVGEPPASGLALHLTDSIPVAWRHWKDQYVGETVDDLLIVMQTQTSLGTF
jgi:hypothetical protein